MNDLGNLEQVSVFVISNRQVGAIIKELNPAVNTEKLSKLLAPHRYKRDAVIMVDSRVETPDKDVENALFELLIKGPCHWEAMTARCVIVGLTRRGILSPGIYAITYGATKIEYIEGR